ncbi:hypothetical protein FB45DRAFT_1024725 [Roridomyces roridus]|uniref:F-box domain-containing protein n=1 Tax=Roridomyces roridus TaxID=1738132 RepID=A0AAD7C1G7_9AGAR|nr:hypothetical protein FB45DRAFT_1024725 [Roridomyces roridus]
MPAADIQVSGVVQRSDPSQPGTWGVLKCNTIDDHDQAHCEFPGVTWDLVSTVYISFPSLDGPLDVYILAGGNFDLGRGRTDHASMSDDLVEPIPVLPGSNLFGYLSWTERQVITSSSIFTYTRKSALIPRIYGLQPNLTATNNSNAGQLTLKQRPGRQVLQDTISNTAFSGIATVGGFWTFVNGAFALLFGANVIYFAFGRRPLSALGVVHIFQRSSLKRQWNQDFPALRTEGGRPGSEAAGIVAFIRERLVDVGEHPPESVDGDGDQGDSEPLQGQDDVTPAGAGVEAQVRLPGKESSGLGYFKCIFRWLPNEVMSEIISYSSRHEKSVLCRVSRLSRQLTLTLLYQRVSVDSYEELYRFWESLCCNLENGVHVASFVLHLLGDPLDTQPDFEIPQELDYIIFNAMTRLETLVLNVPLADARCTEIFRDCSFPRLSTLQYVASEISCNDVLIPFVAAHRQISQLVIGADTMCTLTLERHAPRIAPMAKLTTYVGPSCFTGFIPRGIAHIGLLWTDPQPDVMKMFESLSTVTREGANLTFSCLCEGQPVIGPLKQLARYLARYLPKVEAIQLQENMDNRRFEPEDLECAAQILQSFTTLRYFAFNFM